MKLLTLTLRNFMGIRDFTLDTKGKSVSIYADNGAGKTTLASAWNWLLFDKDSQNRKDFEIKTLENGQPVHGLDHEVEATVEIDGEELTLKKVFAEKWTQTRGESREVFSGHTTQHYIDGVPKPKKDYDAKIASIADEGIFKLLTNPRHFNDSLHWQKRREILLEVCGDVTDAEVIASDKALKDLPGILGKRSLDDHKAVVKERRKKISDRKKDIETRTKEARHGLPDISQIDPAVLESDITKCRKMLEEKQAEKLRIEQGGEIAEKTKQLRQVEAEIIRVEGLHNKEQLALSEEARNKLYAVKAARKELAIDINCLERELERLQDEAKSLAKDMGNLRTHWAKVNAEPFEAAIGLQSADTCPTCGQTLPAEQVEAAKEKALANFNLDKAQRLERITAEGKELNWRKGDVDARATAIETERLTKSKSILADLIAEESRLQAEIIPVKPLGENPDYNRLAKEKANLELEILALQDGGQEEVQAIEAEIDTYELALVAYKDCEDKLKAHTQAEARVKELKAEDGKISREFENLGRELYLCEQFIRTKVAMLDERINRKFRLARFKMFEEQVNGGLAECCETLFDGVPWTGGLNNGAQIRVGIDIINTLAEHYGLVAPIFCDNAESVTELTPTPAQLIRLVVSAKDKNLRVEVEA